MDIKALISELKQHNLWQTGAFINGQWQSCNSQFAVENPANQETIATVGSVNSEQIELAITSASKAQQNWAQTDVETRAALLQQWYQLINEHHELLGHLLTLEQGKVLKEGIGEIVYGASYVKWYAEEARRLGGELLPYSKSGRRSYVRRRPVGVVGAITPWNFPNAMILRKAAPALAAGCALVIKPSELTPLSAAAAVELARRAGFPEGVINLLPIEDPTPVGAAFTSDTRIAKIGFTGSTAVGKQLLAGCGAQVKKASLELGGNAPLLVFDDADLDKAIKGTIVSKFRNAGQTCVCANRLLVQKGIYDDYVSALKQEIEALTVGDGFNETVKIGPLINQAAIDKLQFLLADATSKGAKILCGGKRLDRPGYFFEPTLIVDVTPEMAIFNTEIFGPIASVIRFADNQEAITLANQTNYGLCAYAFTENASRQWRLPEQLDYGMVGINEGLLSNPAAPFGGVKESGMGREGGFYGLQDYVQTQYICVGGIDD